MSRQPADDEAEGLAYTLAQFCKHRGFAREMGVVTYGRPSLENQWLPRGFSEDFPADVFASVTLTFSVSARLFNQIADEVDAIAERLMDLAKPMRKLRPGKYCMGEDGPEYIRERELSRVTIVPRVTVEDPDWRLASERFMSGMN